MTKRTILESFFSDNGKDYTELGGVIDNLTTSRRIAKRIRRQVIEDRAIDKIYDEGDKVFVENSDLAKFIENDLRGKSIVQEQVCDDLISELQDEIDEDNTAYVDDDCGDLQADLAILKAIRETFLAVMPYDQGEGSNMLKDLLYNYALIRNRWIPHIK